MEKAREEKERIRMLKERGTTLHTGLSTGDKQSSAHHNRSA